MSIESITKRIQDEAQAYADERKAEAESQAKEILEAARTEAEQISADAKVRADKDAKLLVERRESVAGLESRKMQLEAKRQVIAESFDKALEKILAMKDADYMAFLADKLAAFEKEGGEILLNAADLEKYGAGLSKLLKGDLKLSEETAKIKGGFILKQGDITINCSVEKLLDNIKEEITGTIAEKLFPNV